MSYKTSLFFLKQRFRPRVLRIYSELLKNQFLCRDELEDLNWTRRKSLLAHAYATVPFYREVLQSRGIRPEDIKFREDWYNLPILTKDDIRTHFNQLVSTAVSRRQLTPITTGGSTGEPLTVLHDRRYPLDPLGWRTVTWWGGRPGDDIAFCYRLLRKSRISRLLNAAMWWPTRRIWLDASMLTEESIRGFVDKFNALKPTCLQGYTGAIQHVAQYILEQNIHTHHPRFVWGTSSPVSAVQRAVIEEAFSAPLYDQYGCCEVFWLAAQCEAREMLHVCADARHIEIVDDNGRALASGMAGNVVVTDLVNYGFPLIRYKNGDVGREVPGACSCGMNLPLISPIKGRITDLLRIPDGGAIGGDYVTTLFDDYPGVVQAFQVRQSADYSLTVLVVPNVDRTQVAQVLTQIKAVLQSKTAGQLAIRTEIVDRIDSDRGKTRYVVSDAPCSNSEVRERTKDRLIDVS